MHIRSPAAADIITRAEPHVKMDEPSGLSTADMKENQQRLVMNLLLEYTSRMPE